MLLCSPHYINYLFELHMKKLIFIILVSLGIKGFSQCQPVCIVGTPTFACSNCGGGGGGSLRQSTQDSINQNTLNTYLTDIQYLPYIQSQTASVQTTSTYSYVVGVGDHTITVGATDVSIANVGTTTASVNGQILPNNVSLHFPTSWNNLLGQFIYNAQASTLLIIVTRP